MKLKLDLRRYAAGVVVAVIGAALSNTVLTADASAVATLDQRLRGAETVVVATIRGVSTEWRENAHGDRLIVSRVELAVDEAVKGAASRTVWMEIEGGSLDGMTLRVTDLPLIRQPGERAVFFLDSVARGLHAPHLRGQGILFLDNDTVRGTTLRLDDIRSRARALAGR